jgi:hypothetical protein
MTQTYVEASYFQEISFFNITEHTTLSLKSDKSGVKFLILVIIVVQ